MKSGAGEDPWGDDDDQDGGVISEETEVEHEALAEIHVDEEETSMVDVIASNLESIDEGEVDNNIGFRHDELKALLESVSESEELREELVALADAVGEDGDAEDLTASDVVRAAALAGLQAEAPGALEALQDAKKQHEGNSLL